MAEPLSFVASVIAVAGLAEKVVTTGYRYLKAVKNCPDEVRSLMAETNVLCGILERLKVLLEGHRATSRASTKSKERIGQDLTNNHGKTNEEETEEVESSEDEVTSISDKGTSPLSIGDTSDPYASSRTSTSRLHLSMSENSGGDRKHSQKMSACQPSINGYRE
jgi:hypothetical protein